MVKPTQDKNEGWRKFSLAYLVWLGIVKDLRDYAKLKGYKVEKVFCDESTLSKLLERPAITLLFDCIKHNPQKTMFCYSMTYPD